MTRITVLGGTGYAGAAIVAEAAARGHQVTSFSRSAPARTLAGVTVVRGDAGDESALKAVTDGAEVVVSALSPRGDLADSWRATNATIARLADGAGARLFVVGGFSSLRPSDDAPRYVADLSDIPEALHHELTTVSDFVVDDLPATPASLDWVFVSPALLYGAHAPGERTGKYRVGGTVAVDPAGGAISGDDYATGFLDLIEAGDHHREHVNLGY